MSRRLNRRHTVGQVVAELGLPPVPPAVARRKLGRPPKPDPGERARARLLRRVAALEQHYGPNPPPEPHP
jgi:hypothetical protein